MTAEANKDPAGAMIDLKISSSELKALSSKRLTRAITTAMRKAASTSVRDMRSEASKRVRASKRIKAKEVRKALVPRRNKGRRIDDMEFGVDVRGDAIRLSAYPHRQTKKGVSVEIDRGKRVLIKSAFMATMASGRRGVYLRRGARRLPIKDLLAARPIEVLKQSEQGEGVIKRGRWSFAATFDRLLPMELDKAKLK